MLLYHFTARRYLDLIMAQGLTKGSVELSASEAIHGIWFTTSPVPVGIGCQSGGIPTLEQKQAMARLGMIPWAMINADLVWPDKREVRITVKLNSNDRRLVRWDRWSRKHAAPEVRTGLIAADGSGYKGWHVFFGTVAPEGFTAVDLLPVDDRRAA